jgi:hypothetical protein
MQKDMIKSGEKVLIVSDSWKSLMDFRGKLIEELAKNIKYMFLLLRYYSILFGKD